MIERLKTVKEMPEKRVLARRLAKNVRDDQLPKTKTDLRAGLTYVETSPED